MNTYDSEGMFPGVYGCDVSAGGCSVPSELFEVTLTPGAKCG